MGKHRPRVAVVDDDPEFVDLMEVLLEEEGFQPDRLDLGRADPVEALATGDYDLVILDIHGVEGHDLSLLQRLRTDERLERTPILVCSADIHLLRENAALLSTLPSVAGLEKPFRIDALSGAIHRLLEGSFAPPPPSPGSDGQALVALQDWLEQLGHQLRWAAMDAWIPNRHPGLLQCAAAWCASERFRPFVHVSRRTHLPIGGGVPGRVWVSGRPAWIEDLAGDLNFPRLPAARRVGLVSAAAAPILDGGVTVGVVAAYNSMRRSRDADVVEQLQAAGAGAVPLFRAAAGRPASG